MANEVNMTREDDTGFRQVETRRGSRMVISTARPNKGWDSRLYVNNGSTATLVRALHKSLDGAMAWADKKLRA